MPTWKERIYEWNLMDGSTSQCIKIAAVLSIFLIAIIVTLIVHRNENDIRMLYLPHILLCLVCSLIFLWSLVFIWQADVKQAQCDSYLWTIYLPASIVIQTINMKAYRLSVFLTSDSKTRKKRFTHHYTMMLALRWIAFTFLTLVIAQLVDPPTSEVVIVDEYRPSKNYHVCRHGSITDGILYFLVIEHMLVSMFCVIIVRNGSEAFKDGMIMKEAFLIFNICIAIAFIFGFLNLSNESNYILRTIFLGVGITMFNFRLLFSRCARHWITRSMAIVILHYCKLFKDLMPADASKYSNFRVAAEELTSGVGNVSEHVVSEIDSSGNVHEEIQEMMEVITNEQRSKLFREVAKKGLVEENVDFLFDVSQLPSIHADLIRNLSTVQNKAVKHVVLKVFEKYCKAGSESEVNIPANMRGILTKMLESWDPERPMISENAAKTIVEEDLLETRRIFEPATREIAKMLYMNIWNKFVTVETESQMSQV
jgi:7 transmembrane sweet-taste receptor of 3 GCPR/Regulator of G protein signaling domain